MFIVVVASDKTDKIFVTLLFANKDWYDQLRSTNVIFMHNLQTINDNIAQFLMLLLVIFNKLARIKSTTISLKLCGFKNAKTKIMLPQY